jgi:catechol-2,3-dioxygenase
MEAGSSTAHPRLAYNTIDHVQLAIPVGGEGEAEAFYRDVLGINVVPKPPALVVA